MDGNGLLNTKASPPWLGFVRAESRRARAYHALQPYPQHSPKVLKDWKTEERGPVPKCRPFVRRMAKRHASWLFGKPLSLTCGEGNEKYTDIVQGVWADCLLLPRMKAAAETGFQSGNVALKWRHDDKFNLSVDVLDASEHVRLFYDPHDAGRLLMARIQYPYFDFSLEGGKGGWVWYREEWTEGLYVEYEPHPMPSGFTQSQDPGMYASKLDESAEWKERARRANPYKAIPVHPIKNIDVGADFGLGDLWGLWDAIDEACFTYDLCNKDNQKSVDPHKYLIDGRMVEDDAPVSTVDAVKEIESLEEGQGAQQAKLQFYEKQGMFREHIQKHADELKRDVMGTVGDVDVDVAEVTNKGAMTSAVLAQLYAPLIERIEDKRSQYGEHGIARFFEKALAGMANVPNSGWPVTPEGLDVQVEWPKYFMLGEDEKLARAERYALMVENDFTTHERAVRELAAEEGDTDVDDLVEEATKAREERKAEEKALADKAVSQPGASQNKAGGRKKNG